MKTMRTVLQAVFTSAVIAVACIPATNVYAQVPAGKVESPFIMQNSQPPESDPAQTVRDKIQKRAVAREKEKLNIGFSGENYEENETKALIHSTRIQSLAMQAAQNAKTHILNLDGNPAVS